MYKRLSPLLPFLLLLGAWALFFWRFAAPGDARLSYPAGDFSMQFGVFRDIAYKSLIEGRLPLWSNCLWSGYPFHADPQAQVFYPPIWVMFAILRLRGWGHFPLGALVAEVTAHYLLTSVFLYVFLRSLKCGRVAAALGALVFTYGGYLTGSPPLQTATLEAVTWLPLALLWVGRWAETRRWRCGALAALMLAVSFLAGHPQTFMYLALLVLAYFAFRAYLARWPVIAWVGASAVLVGLTAALSAVQLLPSAQFIQSSTRGALEFEQAGRGLPFFDVVQFFLTGFVSYWQPLYVGILPLALAVYALPRREAEARFWAGAAVAGLLFSFGTKAVVYDVAYGLVPGYGLFRGQEHVALVVSFSLSVLAGLGAHRLLEPLSRLARKQLRLLAKGTGIGTLVAFALLPVAIYLSRLGLDRSDWQHLPDRLGVMTLAFGLAWIVLLLRLYGAALRRVIPLLGAAVVVVELFMANRPLNVVPAFEAFPNTALLDPLRAETGFYRVQDEYQLPGHAGCAYGFNAVEGITPYRIAAYQDFLSRAPQFARWELLGVRYFFTWQPSQGPELSAVEVAKGPSLPGAANDAKVTHVFRFDGYTVRRAFLVHTVWEIAEASAAYQAMGEAAYEPFLMAILPQSVEASGDGQGDALDILLDRPGQMRFRTSSATPGVLVVSEAYLPTWQVRVDGRPAPVLRADTALLAVAVPAGEHEIEFFYLPPLLLVGGGITVLAFIVTAGMVFWKRRPQRRKQDSEEQV
jgi:hypothetical protein